ncbi:MAG: hypothetical protein V3V96_07455 [Acidiferrobacterales bacterium]
MNLEHPNRIQIVADNALRYLQNLSEQERENTMYSLFSNDKIAALILANNKEVRADFVEHADRLAVPLFSTPLASPVVIEHLQYYLTRVLAPRATLHGVYMEILGMGVFIMGASGIGKSELALELLSRNHRLIADDAVEFVRVTPQVLVGQCPEALSEYLEVRGLGILDIRATFGETSVRHKKKLPLMAQLERLRERSSTRRTSNLFDSGRGRARSFAIHRPGTQSCDPRRGGNACLYPAYTRYRPTKRIREETAGDY